jgi:TPR repeat protein
MKGRILVSGAFLAAQVWGAAGAFAGPWEDGMAAYNRGDYVPAIIVFRALAGEGNTQAQRLLARMYRRGQGVERSPARAYLWFRRAAAKGDARAKAELRQISRSMTEAELSTARAMMQACEASDYRTCEY